MSLLQYVYAVELLYYGCCFIF